MRIEAVDLIAYGHLQDTRIDLSRPATGLTVVCGPNEAGKSTARRALLAALFGIDRSNSDAYAFTRAGMRIGVCLVDRAGRRLSFVRQGGTGAPLGDPGGGVHTAEEVAECLGGVDRQLYVNVFSVDHDELRLRSDDLINPSGGIGRLVFGAALGSASVTQALQRLEQRAASLYTDRGRTQVITSALAAYREGMRAARDARVRSREWDRRQTAVVDAHGKVDELTLLLRRAQAEQSRMTWVASALPLVAQRRALTDQVGEIVASGMTGPREWAERMAAADHALQAAQTGLTAASRQKEDLELRISSIVVSEDFLQRAAAIDELAERVDSYRQAQKDLGKLRGQLSEAQSKVAGLLSRLGLERDDGRLVATADLRTVEDLVRARPQLDTRLESAERELRKLDGDVAAFRRELERMPESRDVAALRRAVDLAQPVVAREDALPAERQAAALLESQVRAEAGRLGLDPRDLDGLAAMRVPSPQQIAGEASRRQALATQRTQLRTENDELVEQRAQLERDAATLRARPDVPDPQRLKIAREHRDAGWHLVRRALESRRSDEEAIQAWTTGAPLAAAYERSVVEADVAADARYDHAAELTQLEQMQAHLTEVARKEQKRQEALGDLEREAATGLQAWLQLWAPIGVDAGDPEAMSAWREAHQALLVLIGKVAESQRSLAASEEMIGSHVGAVNAAVVALGLVPDHASLGHLVTQANEILDDEGTRAERRRDSETKLGLADGGRPDRERNSTEARSALESWERSWGAALTLLRLPAGVSPEAAREAAHAYRDLPASRDVVAGLVARIREMEGHLADVAGKGHRAAHGLLDAGGKEPLAVVAELRAGLSQAREGRTSRETLRSQLAETARALHDAEVQVETSRQTADQLREEQGIPADADLPSILARSRQAAELRTQIGQLEKTLVEQGGGRALEQILVEVEALQTTGDEMAAAVEAVGRDVADLESRWKEANQKLGEARKDVAGVTEASSAADCEQDAQAQLAHAASAAAEYAPNAVAAAVLRNAIQEYGERHRGPVLERASQLFSDITACAFAELLPDGGGENQVLLARRRNGELLTMEKLSDGTRDQLYLALRLAALEHQLAGLTEPVPVLFDDVLVNFDDERSAATLTTLAQLGDRTQVVLFTHHESIVELARSVLPADKLGVALLAPRDQSLPPRGGGDAGKQPSGHAGARVVRPSVVGGNQVLEVLRAAGRPLGKAEILQGSGLPEMAWPSLIHSLLATGEVLQQGERRGARYALRQHP